MTGTQSIDFSSLIASSVDSPLHTDTFSDQSPFAKERLNCHAYHPAIALTQIKNRQRSRNRPPQRHARAVLSPAGRWMLGRCTHCAADLHDNCVRWSNTGQRLNSKAACFTWSRDVRHTGKAERLPVYARRRDVKLRRAASWSRYRGRRVAAISPPASRGTSASGR